MSSRNSCIYIVNYTFYYCVCLCTHTKMEKIKMVVNDVFWQEIRDYRNNAKKRSKHLSLSDRALNYIEAVIDILERDMAMPKIKLNKSMLVEGLVTMMYNNLPKGVEK